jgi:uncharacterized cupredoxin-like copper-binding protein
MVGGSLAGSAVVGTTGLAAWPNDTAAAARTAADGSSNHGTSSQSSAVPHDLAVEGSGNTPLLEPGEQADLELAGLQPGNYVVFCRVPGHREAGMQAGLVIG